VWSDVQLGTSDSLESKFRALEGGDVEDELAQLKKGALTGVRSGSPQQLPEGRPLRFGTSLPALAKEDLTMHVCSAMCPLLGQIPLRFKSWDERDMLLARLAFFRRASHSVGVCMASLRWLPRPFAVQGCH
jgi:hypothetical protein